MPLYHLPQCCVGEKKSDPPHHPLTSSALSNNISWPPLRMRCNCAWGIILDSNTPFSYLHRSTTGTRSHA